MPDGPGPGRYYIGTDDKFILFLDEKGDWKIQPNPDFVPPCDPPADQ